MDIGCVTRGHMTPAYVDRGMHAERTSRVMYVLEMLIGSTFLDAPKRYETHATGQQRINA